MLLRCLCNMKSKKSWVERLAEIAKEYEEPLRGLDYFRSRLGWEDWVGLRQEGVEFARGQIRKRKWRGRRGGVLPGCIGPEDIVDQAIGMMFEGKARLAVGFRRERAKKELERLIDRQVSQLRRLKEARAVRSEWDVLAEREDAKPVSVLTWVGMI
jgi:hypothetical protein